MKGFPLYPLYGWSCVLKMAAFDMFWSFGASLEIDTTPHTNVNIRLSIAPRDTVSTTG